MALSKKAGLELLRQQVEESCAVKRSLSAEFLEGVWTLVERSCSEPSRQLWE